MRPPFYLLNQASVSLLILLLLSTLPFQSQAQSGSVTTTQSFSYTGQIVTWTVPTGVTSLTIEARGAEGAAGGIYAPGKGAIIKGTLTVTPGQPLSILVGQQPVSIQGASTTGGGGGSFVVRSSNPVQPLVIAGGGGGSGGGDNSANLDSDAKNGQAGNNGGAATARSGAGTGGTAGNGGVAGSGQFAAGGGGGVLSDGTSSAIRPGGKAFLNGGAGGLQDQPGDNGGFGGGGSGFVVFVGNNTYLAGGGGGGYSGGGGSSVNNSAGVGGGGGSFNGGTNQTNSAGANSGNGLVTITYATPPQPIRYVKQGGTGDGTSWASASGDLQSQIDIAGAEQVWIAGGRYTRENGGPFSLKNGVAVYGGFVGNETSLRPALSPVNGQPSSTTLTVSSGSVFRNTNLDNTARLDGVVITGGISLVGGGISNVSSSPSLTNCVISGNSANGDGGGISNNNSSPSLTNCVISGNSTNHQGGGISNFSSSPSLTNCLISGNSADQGGGIFNFSSSPSLTNCLISGNSTSLGGGFYNAISSPRLTNCTLTANRAVAGAALINYSGSQPVLTNTILWDNQEAANTAINNDTGTGTTANYCLIGQGETDYTGTNNLTATVSPFVSTTNFMLKAGSHAIDAGDPASTTATSGTTDLAGDPRVFNSRIDQGAYEFQVLPTQPIRYVKQDGSGDGTSWANASGDLQSQIDIAGAEQVWVATGLYKPGPANNTNRSISFVMKNGVAIYGGFPPDNSGTLANRNPVSFTTVLSGDIDGDGTLAGNSYHVVSISNASAATRLDGFVITSGNAAGGGESNNGGGIYNIGSGGNRSNPTLVNLTFVQHLARFGAGMFNRNGSPSLTNVSFSQNTAIVEGGGIYNDAGSPLLTNCLFSQNRADNGGAMLNYQTSNPLLTNCSFSQNTATTQGGALRNNVNSRPRLTNCILWENGGQNAIVNLTSTNGGTTANYCLIEPAETDYTGQNNRALDPLFVDAAAGNLQLQPCSPAIDAGDNSVNTTPIDLAGNNRRQRTIDLGAYEFQGTPNSPVAITQQPASGSSVCTGSTVTAMVSVSGTVSSYQWYRDGQSVSGQNSATLSLTNVQPVSAGSYSVVATGACNSVTSTAFSLTVNALPMASLTNNGPISCSATSVTLTASGGSTYQFSNGANQIGNGPTATVTTAGVYSVTVISANGCSAVASTMVVGDQNVPTASLTNNGPISCSMTSVTLTASGGSTYRFSSGASQVGSGPTATVTTAGVYSVTVVSANGCSSVASTTVVGDVSVPTAGLTNNGPISCSMTPVTLTASGGSTYRFSSGASQVGSGPTATVTTAGVYSVTVVSSNGCTATASTTVTGDQSVPTAGLTSNGPISCSTTAVTLTASGGSTYRFSSGASQIDNGPTATVTTAGVYSVTVISTNGCSAVASTTVVGDVSVPVVSIQANPSLTITQGQSTLLTASATGSQPLIYSWSNSLTTSAISVSTAGTYSVTVVGNNGCLATASVVVSVTATPVASGPFAITGVSLVSCTPINEFRKVISIQPFYDGLDGSPVSFSVANELRATTEPGPYTLQLYVDNPTITLRAVQSRVLTSFTYNWLAACNSGVTPPPSVSNTAPTVVSPVGNQTATAGGYFSLNLATTFTDDQTPNGLVLSASGLPAGLSLSGTTLSGIVSLSGVSTIIITATDPGNLSISTSFILTVLPVPAGNTAPTVVNPVGSQTATTGQFFTLSVANVLTDRETPNALTLSAGGLPAGLILMGTSISGTPSMSGTTTVTLTATDPGSLSTSTSFILTVTAPASSTSGGAFALVGVSTISCTPIVAGRIDISFSPQYTGLNSSPVTFSVANELAATTVGGPYSLQLYIDNPTITLQALQSGVGSSFAYNWLAACQSGGTPTPTPGNTAPRVVQAVSPQSATVGQAYTLSIANVFADTETPSGLVLSAAGLPAGLSLTGTTISGTPSVSGTATVVVTASDPGSLSASTSFVLTVSPAASVTTCPPSAGFSNTGVQTLSCVTAGTGQRSVTFVPQYAGLTGQALTFSVVNELAPTTAGGPYTLRLYTDNPLITLKATQAGSADEASFSYNWLAACNSGNTRRAAEPVADWQVVVLGNPVVGETVEVEVRGAGGESLRVETLSEQGYRLDRQGIESAREIERFTLPVGPSAGIYLLRVSSPFHSQTLKLLKR